MTLACNEIDTPLGPMVLAASSAGLAGAWFLDQKHLPDMSTWQTDAAHAVLVQTKAQFNDYFAGRRLHFELPLAAAWGTAFQQAVWQALRAIPTGRTSGYGELARQLKRPQAARAVGAAVGRNPWSIIVPCHRVLGADGGLTGYAGGLERKVALLRLEGMLL